MKITEVELFHISIPFAQPYHLSKLYGTLHNAHAVILKIKTDNGIIGLGEADPMAPFTKESPEEVMTVVDETIDRFTTLNRVHNLIKECCFATHDIDPG